jgi:hypothetical protein
LKPDRQPVGKAAWDRAGRILGQIERRGIGHSAGYSFEWTGTAYQEVAAAGLTGAILGLVVLIAVAAKNCILIVEFAKDRGEEGMDIREAACSARGCGFAR